jgi:hypothetical protein
MVGLAYNWRFKQAGLVGNLMVSSSVAITFILGAIAVGDPWNPVVWVFSLIAFGINLGEEIAGDAMDIEGRSQTRLEIDRYSEGQGLCAAGFRRFVQPGRPGKPDPCLSGLARGQLPGDDPDHRQHDRPFYVQALAEPSRRKRGAGLCAAFIWARWSGCWHLSQASGYLMG